MGKKEFLRVFEQMPNIPFPPPESGTRRHAEPPSPKIEFRGRLSTDLFVVGRIFLAPNGMGEPTRAARKRGSLLTGLTDPNSTNHLRRDVVSELCFPDG